MSLKSLQEYTYYSKYARHNKEKKRRETWAEATARVKEMHLRKYPQLKDELEWAFKQVLEKRVLGSQRALQFGGTPIESKNARMFNCISSYCDRLRFFQECFWLLLCGCGTGFSVQLHHVKKLPDFLDKNYVGSKGKKTYIIPDSIEGWSDSLGVLLSSYFEGGEFPEYSGHEVVFDYSKIRPKGSSLSSGAGKAPGHEPLKNSHEKIKKLLDACLSKGQKRVKPIDAYDIVMHTSDAVLAGGVRRSATLCMFSFEDKEMMAAKTGNWFMENPQRGRSNNSVVLLRNATTAEQFDSIMNSVKEFGEPGFIWVDDLESLYNPCVEINYIAYDVDTNQSGWCACNLCEINGLKLTSKQDFEIATRAASIIGTCQAGFTDFQYLGPVTKKIIEREALLGISITGMQDNPHIALDQEIQKEMALLSLEVNKEIASKIGINPTARATCIKPAGTTSCILGTASGIHPHHSKRYLRRVQANSLEPVFKHFKKYNPSACSPSVWSSNKTDEVITFCVEVPDGAKTKNDLSAIQLLELVKSTQQNWVKYGKEESRCVKPWLTHNVSNTINVRDNEWDDVKNFIYENRAWFAGISLIPQSGDLDYNQAPMCNVSTPKEIIKKYGDGALFASGLIVDGLHVFNNDLWSACDAVLFKIDGLSEDKKDWIRRVVQFANRYCDGDVRKCCYLMKEVSVWKIWKDLNREYKDVDYTTLTEEEDNTKPQQEWACSGGSCELK